MGQLLVVTHQTAYELSLCYEPELIPDQYYYWPKAHATGPGRVLIWDQVLLAVGY